MPDEAAALITLLRHGARSWREYVEMIEDADSAQAILEREQQHTLFALDTTEADRDLVRWRAQGLRLRTVFDPDYPENLRGVHDRPPFVFTKGQLVFEDSKAIAVIGGRKPTPFGLNRTVTVVSELVSAGFTIVSGLAAGIDTAAHKATLDRHGRTIAVVGTGLNHAYPRQNEGLQQVIAQKGAVVSQFWPDEPPSRTSFPLRNATMSGLALGTVIIEASDTSGTRIQARRALGHGRPLFLLESLAQQQSWAAELAVLPGTHVVRTGAEIAERIERQTAPGILTR
jgi:DNA processing protein